jgi:thiamine biosynthesis lipoprotein
MATVLSLSDRALSTSGDYQKFFTDAEGKRLSHIIDPKTGWPVQHSVTSVSVIATNSMTADALATTLFVMGQEKGLRFVEARPDAAALFILRESDGKYRLLPSSRWPR